MYHQWPSLQFTHCTDNHDNAASHGVIVLAQWFDNYIELYNCDFHSFIRKIHKNGVKKKIVIFVSGIMLLVAMH